MLCPHTTVPHVLCLSTVASFQLLIITLSFSSLGTSPYAYISESIFWTACQKCKKDAMKQKFINCLALFKHITIHESSSFIFCDHCFSFNIVCIMMSDSSKNSLKCAVYTHHGCLCVDISLESLNCAHKKLKFNLEAVVKEHAEHSAAVARLDAKLSCLLKKMKQSRIISTLKACCVVFKLDDNNDETENETSSIVSQSNNVVLQSFLDFLLFSPQNVEASLHSSWDFAWVFKLILRYCILFTWQDSELLH